MTTLDIIGIARRVLSNPNGWTVEYLTPWRGFDVVLAYNPVKQSGDSGLPIYILVKDDDGRYATADETLEIMNLSLPDVEDDSEISEKISEISE